MLRRGFRPAVRLGFLFETWASPAPRFTGREPAVLEVDLPGETGDSDDERTTEDVGAVEEGGPIFGPFFPPFF